MQQLTESATTITSLMDLSHLSYSTTPKGSCCNAWKTQCSNDVPKSANRFYEIFLITYTPYVALFPHESLRC